MINTFIRFVIEGSRIIYLSSGSLIQAFTEYSKVLWIHIATPIVLVEVHVPAMW